MITLAHAEPIVRSCAHRLGIQVLERELPEHAVCAAAKAPNDVVYLIVDTTKPSAWGHAREMLLEDAEVFGCAASERTVLMSLPIPTGRPWVYMEDANILVLSEDLDGAGQRQAVSEAAEVYCLS